MMTPKTPSCPRCGRQAITVRTQYGLRHTCCGLWSWDGKELCDAGTHRARQKAHEIFDRLWRGPRAPMTRSFAYRMLREELGLTSAECHMSVMDEATAARVPDAVYAIRERLGKCLKHTTPDGSTHAPTKDSAGGYADASTSC